MLSEQEKREKRKRAAAVRRAQRPLARKAAQDEALREALGKASPELIIQLTRLGML